MTYNHRRSLKDKLKSGMVWVKDVYFRCRLDVWHFKIKRGTVCVGPHAVQETGSDWVKMEKRFGSLQKKTPLQYIFVCRAFGGINYSVFWVERRVAEKCRDEETSQKKCERAKSETASSCSQINGLLMEAGLPDELTLKD